MAEPEYKDHRLTREGMMQVLREGGSVLHRTPDGQPVIITHPDRLPSQAEIARGNPQAETQAAADLQARIDQMQAELRSLTQSKRLPEAPPAPAPSAVASTPNPPADKADAEVAEDTDKAEAERKAERESAPREHRASARRAER